MSEQNNAAIEYLYGLAGEKFWGSISIKFEAGRVVHIRREENIKPEQLSGKLRLLDEKYRN